MPVTAEPTNVCLVKLIRAVSRAGEQRWAAAVANLSRDAKQSLLDSLTLLAKETADADQLTGTVNGTSTNGASNGCDKAALIKQPVWNARQYRVIKRQAYSLRLNSLGAETDEMDLTQPYVSKEIIAEIIADVAKHRLVVFRNQHKMTPERQVEIGRWFGQVDAEGLLRHPKAPMNEVYRISNDPKEGVCQAGRSGWHIDCSYYQRPASNSIYFMVHVPKEGDTRFIGLMELLDSLPAEQRQKLDRLWFCSDRWETPIHPLVYKHPLTGLPAMCFHNGKTASFIWDYGTEAQRQTAPPETREIVAEIEAAIASNEEELVYSHKWMPGDFIIADNLALGHEASEQTQYSREEVGLRVLHRVTVAGKCIPKK